MADRLPYLVFLLFWAATCLSPPCPRELVLQHIPTVIALAALGWCRRRLQLSRASVRLVLLFLALHALGARYLYSYVPYDDWSVALGGRPISSQFGFTRNHYDRLVHFAYGLLLYVPLAEAIERTLKPRGAWSGVLAVQGILATSAAYEIIEWCVALTFAPDWAEHYNGQQGDLWDAQKDMSLAAAGALVALICDQCRRIQRSTR
jgi:putative membrane protein